MVHKRQERVCLVRTVTIVLRLCWVCPALPVWKLQWVGRQSEHRPDRRLSAADQLRFVPRPIHVRVVRERGQPDHRGLSPRRLQRWVSTGQMFMCVGVAWNKWRWVTLLGWVMLLGLVMLLGWILWVTDPPPETSHVTTIKIIKISRLMTICLGDWSIKDLLVPALLCVCTYINYIYYIYSQLCLRN